MSTSLTPRDQFIANLKKDGLIQGKDFFVSGDKSGITFHSNGRDIRSYQVDENGNGFVREEQKGLFNRFPHEGISESEVVGFKKEGWEILMMDSNPCSKRTVGIFWKDGKQISKTPEVILAKVNYRTLEMRIKVLNRQR